MIYAVALGVATWLVCAAAVFRGHWRSDPVADVGLVLWAVWGLSTVVLLSGLPVTISFAVIDVVAATLLLSRRHWLARTTGATLVVQLALHAFTDGALHAWTNNTIAWIQLVIVGGVVAPHWFKRYWPNKERAWPPMRASLHAWTR